MPTVWRERGVWEKGRSCGGSARWWWRGTRRGVPLVNAGGS